MAREVTLIRFLKTIETLLYPKRSLQQVLEKSQRFYVEKALQSPATSGHGSQKSIFTMQKATIKILMESFNLISKKICVNSPTTPQETKSNEMNVY